MDPSTVVFGTGFRVPSSKDSDEMFRALEAIGGGIQEPSSVESDGETFQVSEAKPHVCERRGQLADVCVCVGVISCTMTKRELRHSQITSKLQS